jgi:hypothetical protein
MINESVLLEFYKNLENDKVAEYKRLSNEAIKLGYNPKRDKTKTLSISFSNSKTKKTLLKYAEEKWSFFWKLKFYACNNYSEIFDRSIKDIIERFDFKYVGCYGCGKCKNEKLGYKVNYMDGRQYFRCGFELIPIRKISSSIVDEAIRMMNDQHKAFIEELQD